MHTFILLYCGACHALATSHLACVNESGGTGQPSCKHVACCDVLTLSVFVWQLVVVAYDDGDPVKENKTLVEVTVLQPSVIPVFTQEEYRYVHIRLQQGGEKMSFCCSNSGMQPLNYGEGGTRGRHKSQFLTLN